MLHTLLHLFRRPCKVSLIKTLGQRPPKYILFSSKVGTQKNQRRWDQKVITQQAKIYFERYNVWHCLGTDVLTSRGG